MKKILLILAFALSMGSCLKYPTTTYEKPFVIIEKGTTNGYESRFTYQDKNGNTKSFYDYSEKYNVGDTIQ
jgi:hypothetical protein